MFAVTTLLALHVAEAGEMDFQEFVPPDQAEFPAMADELSSGDDRRRVWDAWSLFRGVDDDMNDEELEDLMDTMSAADLDELFANGGERAMEDDYDFSRAIYDDWRVRGVDDEMNDEELEDLMDTMSAADLDAFFANGGERAMDDDYDFMARSLDFGEHMGLARGVDDGGKADGLLTDTGYELRDGACRTSREEQGWANPAGRVAEGTWTEVTSVASFEECQEKCTEARTSGDGCVAAEYNKFSQTCKLHTDEITGADTTNMPRWIGIKQVFPVKCMIYVCDYAPKAKMSRFQVLWHNTKPATVSCTKQYNQCRWDTLEEAKTGCDLWPECNSILKWVNDKYYASGDSVARKRGRPRETLYVKTCQSPLANKCRQWKSDARTVPADPRTQDTGFAAFHQWIQLCDPFYNDEAFMKAVFPEWPNVTWTGAADKFRRNRALGTCMQTTCRRGDEFIGRGDTFFSSGGCSCIDEAGNRCTDYRSEDNTCRCTGRACRWTNQCSQQCGFMRRYIQKSL